MKSPKSKSFTALVLHQSRYDALAFVRNGQSTFFTLALPVIFLLLFASVFGSQTVLVAGGTLKQSVYYVPAIMALGVIAAAFVNLVITVTAARETGIYKRRRATPVPAGAVIAGRALIAVALALAIAVVLLGIGWPVFGANIPGHTAPALIVALVVGALAFCALGFALASLIANADSAQPLIQAIILPLYFISGVFIPAATIPGWLTTVANLFPVRHFAQALLAAYNPHTSGAGFAWNDLAIVALWGVVGLIVAVRRFRWLPQSG
ncbi:MAG TPA: ABC transporter permease [Dehalococcoidia bacterium]|jgi:ABC-2 type transport system permease protein